MATPENQPVVETNDVDPSGLRSDSVVSPSSILQNESGASSVEFNDFDRGNVSVEKVSGAILTAIVGVAAIVGGTILFFAVGLGWVFYSCLGGAACIYSALIWFSFVWPGIEHRHRSWRMTEVGLEVKHGVWWKHMQAIPWARVQHADVSQGPLQRMYSVGTLTVHTAGTSNSSVNLEGLSHEVAIELRDEIIRQRTGADVV